MWSEPYRAGSLSLLAAALLACSDADVPDPGPVLPCDVDAALEASCRSCHGSPPDEGVPIPLVTYADTQVEFEPTPGKAVWKIIGEVLEADQMPAPPETITEPDKKRLLEWVGAGAPPASLGNRCGR